MEKMKIFVSWSGPRKLAVAEALKEYLPIINNAFELWLSSDDIAKGSRSTLEIAKALVAAKAGIICLTPNNLAGALDTLRRGRYRKTGGPNASVHSADRSGAERRECGQSFGPISAH